MMLVTFWFSDCLFSYQVDLAYVAIVNFIIVIFDIIYILCMSTILNSAV